MPTVRYTTYHTMNQKNISASDMLEFFCDYLDAKENSSDILDAMKDRFGEYRATSYNAIQKRMIEVALRDRDMAPVLENIISTGVKSHADIARKLNARGIPAPRGGEWYQQTVRRMMIRLNRGIPQFDEKPRAIAIHEIEERKLINDQFVLDKIASNELFVDVDRGHAYGGIGLNRSLGRPNKEGYIKATLSKGTGSSAVRRSIFLHRIVWISANGPIPKGMVIDHINNIRNDNRLINLRVVTPTVNSKKVHEQNRVDTSKFRKHSVEFITALCARHRNNGEPLYRLSKEYGIPYSTLKTAYRNIGNIQ